MHPPAQILQHPAQTCRIGGEINDIFAPSPKILVPASTSPSLSPSCQSPDVEEIYHTSTGVEEGLQSTTIVSTDQTIPQTPATQLNNKSLRGLGSFMDHLMQTARTMTPSQRTRSDLDTVNKSSSSRKRKRPLKHRHESRQAQDPLRIHPSQPTIAFLADPPSSPKTMGTDNTTSDDIDQLLPSSAMQPSDIALLDSLTSDLRSSYQILLTG